MEGTSHCKHVGQKIYIHTIGRPRIAQALSLVRHSGGELQEEGGGILILSRRSIQSGEALGCVCRLDYPGEETGSDRIERAHISVGSAAE